MLIQRDRLAQIRALGTGRLKNLSVGLGKPVVPDQLIGEIFQDDLEDAINETTRRLAQVKDEHLRLTQFENDERRTQQLAIARLKASIDRTIANSTEGLEVAKKIVDGSVRLRNTINLSNLEYFKDLQQKYSIQNDLNTGRSRLAELELTRLTSENQRERARLQRELEINRLETKLDLDRKKLGRTSQIVSHTHGTVTQILTAADEFVREGAPVVLLSTPRELAPGTDDLSERYEAILFVPAGEGKKINVKDFVEVMPATIKREEYGFLHGKVVAVSELPATRLAMEAALQHPDLVDAFLKKYAPGVLLRVYVRLDELAPQDYEARKAKQGWNGNCYQVVDLSGLEPAAQDRYDVRGRDRRRAPTVDQPRAALAEKDSGLRLTVVRRLESPWPAEANVFLSGTAGRPARRRCGGCPEISREAASTWLPGSLSFVHNERRRAKALLAGLIERSVTQSSLNESSVYGS